LRLSTSVERGVLVVVAVVLTAVLSYAGIRNARASHYVGLQTASGYERAVQLEPGDPRNWYLLGRYWQHNLEQPDLARAIQDYQTALYFAPNYTNVLLELATAYETQDDVSKAREAYRQALKSYPVSAEASWRYGNFLLRQGDIDSAFTVIRHAVQADPSLSPAAFSRCLRVQNSPDEVLDRVIPPSREGYVEIIWDQVTDLHPENALKAWDRLATLHPRISLNEVFYLVETLRSRKQYSDALRVWNQGAAFAGFADLRVPSDSAIWDGGFESGVRDGGFAWRFPETFQGVQINLDTREKHSGSRSLRVTFDGKSNTNFTGVCQQVPVRPATSYRLSAWVKTRELTTDEGLRFQISSPHGSSDAITRDVHGTTPWILIELPWNSGDVQEIGICLRRAQSYQGDGKISGAAWVDDVSLVPLPNENPRP
jgi:tetratricopeptide (TPR) repeat protein